jgi:hypothetical protein
MEVLEDWGSWLYIAMVMIVSILNSFFGSNPWVLKALGIAGFAYMALFLSGAFYATLVSNRKGNAKQRIDQEIERRAIDTGDADSVKAAVLESEAAREGGRRLADQRLERFLVDDQLLRIQAESEVLKFLPGVPPQC